LDLSPGFIYFHAAERRAPLLPNRASKAAVFSARRRKKASRA
jgi:hypothetical protein